MADFLKSVFKALASIVVAYAVLFLMGFLLLVGLAAFFTPEPEVIEGENLLVFDLGIALSEKPVGEDPGQLIQQALSGDEFEYIHLRKLITTIDEARYDSRISGMVIVGQPSTGYSFANLQEIRSAISRFNSDKPSYSLIDGDTAAGLYLKTAAQEVFAETGALHDFKGLRAEVLYFADGLNRIGVGVQVVKTGPYKSAGEPFVQAEMSSAQREQLGTLVDDIWDEIILGVASASDLTPTDLEKIVDQSPVPSSKLLVEEGIADHLVYRDQFLDAIADKHTFDPSINSFRQIDMFTYSGQFGGSPMMLFADNEVAVVYAEGQIVDGEGADNEVGGDRLSRVLRSIRKNSNIRAVVLRVNSPGGSATASAKIERELRLLKEEKPLVVSMGGMATSGGYWISSPADKILAQPSTITGSIGVVGIYPNIEQLSQNLGLNFEAIETNQNSGIFSMVQKKDPESIAIIESLILGFYDEFLDLVSETRGLSRSEVEALAGGRVWSGTSSLENGLIDAFGGIGDAIQEAADLAGIGNNFVLREFPREQTLEEAITELLEGNVGQVKADSLEGLLLKQYASNPDSIFGRLGRELKNLDSLNDPHGIYSLLPYNVEIK